MIKRLTILFCITLFTAYSQEKKVVTGYIVSKTNDTIRGSFIGVSNMFKKDLFNPASFDKRITILLENEDAYEYKPNELKSLHIFHKYENRWYKFVGIEADQYKRFHHEIYTGRISFYRRYTQDMRANLIPIDVFVKNNEIQKITLFNFRENIGDMLIDYPTLFHPWIKKEDGYESKNLHYIISLYNKYFEDNNK